jgi:hypothetical protein
MELEQGRELSDLSQLPPECEKIPAEDGMYGWFIGIIRKKSEHKNPKQMPEQQMIVFKIDKKTESALKKPTSLMAMQNDGTTIRQGNTIAVQGELINGNFGKYACIKFQSFESRIPDPETSKQGLQTGAKIEKPTVLLVHLILERYDEAGKPFLADRAVKAAGEFWDIGPAFPELLGRKNASSIKISVLSINEKNKNATFKIEVE